MAKKITAAELMAELNADPKWVADRARQEAELQKRAAELRQAEAALVRDLRKADYQIDSVWDLVNTSTPYPTALPILLEHLQRSYPVPIREGIARALAVRDAAFAWDVILHRFHNETDERAKDGLAVALAVIAGSGRLEEVLGLLRDKKHGSTRILLLSTLRRSKDPRAAAALIELSADPQLSQAIEQIQHRRRKNKRSDT